jgi:hypothetical protein
MRQVAYHEAGHAVTNLAIGWPLDHVAIDRQMGSRNTNNDPVPDEAIKDEPRVILAGFESEKHFFGKTVADPESSQDYQMAAQFNGPEFRDHIPASAALVRENADAIEALAETLLEKDRIEGPEAKEIFDRVKGQRQSNTGLKVEPDRDSSVSGPVSQKAETLRCDSTVSGSRKHSVSKPCDSTVSKVVNLADRKSKKHCDSTVSKGKKQSSIAPAERPKSLPGYEWRRQGTGWTLLRSWYEPDGKGGRTRKREYVHHYSASAIKEAETLKGAL